MSRLTSSLIVFLIGLFFLPEPVFSNDDKSLENSISAHGVIKGLVVSLADRSPIANAHVLIEELDRGTASHRNGDFIFRNVTSGTYLLRVQHLSYETAYQQIEVAANDTVEVTIALGSGRIRADEVVVSGEYTRDDQTTGVERVLTGRQLRQQLGQTIAETLDDEPGLAQRSMGPAPARPVLRGLGGDRLLILEDGGRTGDLSATASDHALAIEPMTAEHIELIRGPSALIHGSNTMGGVINVIRGQIPMDRPDHIHSSGTLQGQSVNMGSAAGVRAIGPLLDSFAYRVDGSFRTAQNMNIPGGELDNTGITTWNASAGLSLIRHWGMVGVSGNFIDTRYGVPGGLDIVDAHPNGVDIEMFRRYMEVKSRFNLGDGFFKRLDADATYSYYKHDELEKPESSDFGRIVGSRFGVLTHNAKMHLHHNSVGIIEKGLFGIWGEVRDYASGARSETPETLERGLGIYSFQESTLNNWNLQLALRFDIRNVAPKEERFSDLIGDMRERSFSGFSSSFRAAYRINNDLKVGSTIMRSFRAPGIEELFSEGPHLANFSFEKGNPELDAERGLGLELFMNAYFHRLSLRAAVFRNQFDNYIFPRDTNERSTRRNSLNKFVFNQERVLMTGFELDAAYRLTSSLELSGALSYVRGDFFDEGESIPFIKQGGTEFAVPMMPPLSGRAKLEWSRGNLRVGAATRFASRQDRLDLFEESTDGYMTYDAFAQYNLNAGKVLHTFTLNVENLTNTTYRNHLSRIKKIYPEPGLNLRLLYRFYF